MCEIDSTYDEKKLFPPIIAVDFDGTLVENEFPNIGSPDPVIVEAVRAYQNHGWKLILWTCRTGDMLQDAVDFCANTLDLQFDAVNQNLPEVQQFYGGDTRKVFANMYIDDRSAALFVDKDKPSSFEPIPLVLHENCVLTMDVEYGV